MVHSTRISSWNEFVCWVREVGLQWPSFGNESGLRVWQLELEQWGLELSLMLMFHWVRWIRLLMVGLVHLHLSCAWVVVSCPDLCDCDCASASRKQFRVDL